LVALDGDVIRRSSGAVVLASRSLSWSAALSRAARPVRQPGGRALGGRLTGAAGSRPSVLLYFLSRPANGGEPRRFIASSPSSARRPAVLLWQGW